MKETFNLEIKEAGVWQSIFTTTDLAEAAREASFLVLNIREEWIRILNGQNKEL